MKEENIQLEGVKPAEILLGRDTRHCFYLKLIQIPKYGNKVLEKIKASDFIN